MASLTRSTKLPAALAEAAEIRAKQLGYVSWNAYIKGLIRYDLVVQGDHTVSLPWSRESLDTQDRIDAELLKMTNKGKGARGQFLAHVLERMQAGQPPHKAVRYEEGQEW